MQAFLRIALVLAGLANIAWGLFAFSAPDRAAAVLEFGLTSVEGRGEIRATYGGLILGLGLALLVALRRPDARGSLNLLAIVFGALSLGRLGSLVLDGFSTYTASVAALEILFTGFLALAARYWEPPVKR